MTKAIDKTEFILRHIRANNKGTYDGEKARLLLDWLVENNYIKLKGEA